MSLRRRAAVLTSAVVVLTVLAVLVLARQVTAGTLVSTIDADLQALAAVAERTIGNGGPGRGGSLSDLRDLDGRGPGGPGMSRRGPGLLSVDGPVQFLTADGLPTSGEQQPQLPVSDAAADLARAATTGHPGPLFEEVEVDGTPLRLLTHPLPGGGAVQLGRSLVEVEAALETLNLRLLTAGTLLAVLAAAVAVAVAARITRPVAELTATAEYVARTQQLDQRIAPAGDDELSRLGRAFDDMLARLEQARGAQTQLIADASHELRTPLTSLRTNIDLLRSGIPLGEDDHRQLLADLGDQLTRFGTLVDGLVELARAEAPLNATHPLRIDTLVAEVADAASRDHPAARITLDTSGAAAAQVQGDRTRLTRAIRTLLDNAVLHGGGEVEVSVEVADDRAYVRVRDHGPGFGREEGARALERFYRGEAARERPGSGLGLAIAAQTAQAHGGSVEVTDSDDGAGARVTLAVPLASGAAPPTT